MERLNLTNNLPDCNFLGCPGFCVPKASGYWQEVFGHIRKPAADCRKVSVSPYCPLQSAGRSRYHPNVPLHAAGRFRCHPIVSLQPAGRFRYDLNMFLHTAAGFHEYQVTSFLKNLI